MSVDKHIVSLEFDNAKFESKVKGSLSTLQNLKKSLQLDNASQGMEKLQQTSNKFSLKNLENGLNTIAQRFTTLGIIGTTALINITNSAVNAGKRIVSALTIDPIKTGLQEYETKMGAIQTILTNTKSKGSTLADVNKTLNELNEYSDKTIYNFAEMARNIGTFTAAGVGLNDSATAIKGIANLAAGSGSTSAQASTAMYQLSQALAAGSVKLQDWNSVVNAGMGGELFQNALKDMAKQQGVFVDESIPFRETLQSGWITADILTKTLQKFAEDESLVKAATEVKSFTQLYDTMQESVQSGWAISWEQIIGDKGQSTAMLTDISQAFEKLIGPSTDARNNMLKFWNENGGRDSIINGISKAFNLLLDVLGPIKEGFREVFPAMTGERLVEISKKFETLMKSFKIEESTLGNIKNTFKGFFAVLSIGKQLFIAITAPILKFVQSLLPAGDGILSLTGGFGSFLVRLDETIKSTGIFTKIFTPIGTLLSFVGAGFSGLVKGLISFGGAITDSVGRLEPLKTLGGLVSKAFNAMGRALSDVTPLFANLGTAILDGFSNIISKIIGSFANADYGSIWEFINGGIIATILLGFKNFMEDLGSYTGGIKDILGSVKGSLEAYQKDLKAGTLIKIAKAMFILAAAIVALSFIDPGRLTSALTAMGVMFAELFGAMMLFEKISSGPGFLAMAKISVGMIALSVSMAILSGALLVISKLDWNGVAKGLTTVGILLLELSLFMNATDLSGGAVRKSAGIVLLAGALVVLSVAVSKFGSMDLVTLAKGLGAVAISLAQFAIFTKLMPNPKGLITTALGLTILSAGLIVMAKAINAMGSIDSVVIAKGLITMAGALTIIGVAITLMPAGMLSAGAGLLVISGAITVLGNALKTMGSMSWSEIGQGLALLAGTLTILTVAMNLMQTSIAGAAAMIVLATAITILSVPLKTFGAMPLGEIGKSLLMLAGAFTVIGVAGLVLAPLVPVLLGLGGGIALIGAGAMAAGVGIGLIATGLAALAVSGVAAGSAVVVLITSVLSILPAMVKAFGDAIIQLATIIGQGAPSIVKAFGQIIEAFIPVITTLIPKVVNGIITLLLALVKAIIDNLPKFIQAGVDIILALLKGISDNVGKLAKAGTDVIVAFLKAIGDNLPRITTAGFDLVIALIDGLTKTIKSKTPVLEESIRGLIRAMISAAIAIVTAPATGAMSIGIDIVKGIISGISSKMSAAKEAITNLGSTLLSSAKTFFDINSPSRVMRDQVGVYLVQGIAEGITKDMSAEEAMAKKASNIVNAFKDAVSKLDLSMTTIDLEHKLWGSKNPKADTGVALSRELDSVKKKAEIQKEVVNASMQEYKKLSSELGKNAVQTQESYNRYLQEQIKLQDLVTNQDAVLDAQLKNTEEKVQKNREALFKYVEYLNTHGETLKRMGIKDEVVEQTARKVSGYEPDKNTITTAAKKDTEGAIVALKESQPKIEAASKEVATSMHKGFTGGEEATKDVAKTTNIVSSVKKVMDDTLLVVKSKAEEFKNVGSENMVKVIEGVTASQEPSTQAVSNIVQKMLQTIHSQKPSFVNAGELLVAGFVEGVNNKSGDLATAVTSMVKDALAAAKSAMSSVTSSSGSGSGGFKIPTGSINISQAAKDWADKSKSSITPVLDISSVKKSVSSLSTGVSRGIASSVKKFSSDGNSSGTNVSFTQNNYSPKALSRTEIYRRTSNQISKVKEVLT